MHIRTMSPLKGVFIGCSLISNSFGQFFPVTAGNTETLIYEQTETYNYTPLDVTKAKCESTVLSLKPS